MRSTLSILATAGAVAALGTVPAAAGTMHPELGARLSGMGHHGIVNLQSQLNKGRLCWTFDLTGSGWTGATIRDANGMIVARLGTAYRAKSCARVSPKALGLLEARPGKYRVWVDVKGHPGELRGALFAGMAHM